MAKRVGRPMKYKHFITSLNDDQLFTPAEIVDKGERSGILDEFIKATNYDRARTRVRHTLARFSKNHNFPLLGDGVIIRVGQQPQRAWYGWRWKLAANREGDPSKQSRVDAGAGVGPEKKSP